MSPKYLKYYEDYVLLGLLQLEQVSLLLAFLAEGQKTLQARAISDTESRCPAEPKCYLASHFEDARDHKEAR